MRVLMTGVLILLKFVGAVSSYDESSTCVVLFPAIPLGLNYFLYFILNSTNSSVSHRIFFFYMRID